MLKTFASKLAVVGGVFFVLFVGFVLVVAHTLEAAAFMAATPCRPILTILPHGWVDLLFRSHFAAFFTVIVALGVIQFGALGGAVGGALDVFRRRKSYSCFSTTMNSPFSRLNVDRQLACEFLGVFARYEFALKAAGFAHGDDATPSWDRYARTIDAAFALLNSPELTTATDYLLTQPPKKQVLDGVHLQWRDAPPDPHLPRAEQILLMVRRVRNNLFHGGKFLPGGDRDQELVSHALVVLRACLPLQATVQAAFEN